MVGFNVSKHKTNRDMDRQAMLTAKTFYIKCDDTKVNNDRLAKNEIGKLAISIISTLPFPRTRKPYGLYGMTS